MDHLSTKRILITGGLGYIGSEIFKMVKQYSEECLSIDKLADVSGNVQSLNLKDAAKTSKLIIDFKPDVIIHCATHSALAYRDHLSNSFQEDFSATVNMLNALAGMRDCRLIYLSSSYVYSGLAAHQYYDEDSLLAPKHNFGIAKSFFEQFILKIHPNTVIFRLCSVFGPGQAMHPNVILAFAEECLKNHSLTVWGKGERKLQYIYIKDAVNIILRSFDLVTGIYNLGGDDYISTRDTAEDIAKFFKVKVNFLENKPEGETLPFLSNQKVKNNLKNDLFTSFSITLNEYLMSLGKT
ncbi:MAG: NAD(P)-dependent oxidoreductase [Candidatus Staskawiczbacteria bacterium]|nr:NAD(P)-dependent oxidoreductase [Candidatus Staskawiczbacteria bacterium]